MSEMTRNAHADDTTNGAAMAAFLAAGMGCFAMGLFVILNEAGLFTPPTLYGPAGGVSGRTTFAVTAWLIAWGVLHARWAGKEITSSVPWVVTLVLTALGVLAALPPVWALL